MDPLLHMGVVLRCVAAYTGGYATKVNEPAENGHKSLQEYVEQVQKAQRIDFTVFKIRPLYWRRCRVVRIR